MIVLDGLCRTLQSFLFGTFDVHLKEGHTLTREHVIKRNKINFLFSILIDTALCFVRMKPQNFLPIPKTIRQDGHPIDFQLFLADGPIPCLWFERIDMIEMLCPSLKSQNGITCIGTTIHKNFVIIMRKFGQVKILLCIKIVNDAIHTDDAFFLDIKIRKLLGNLILPIRSQHMYSDENPRRRFFF